MLEFGIFQDIDSRMSNVMADMIVSKKPSKLSIQQGNGEEKEVKNGNNKEQQQKQ